MHTNAVMITDGNYDNGECSLRKATELEEKSDIAALRYYFERDKDCLFNSRYEKFTAR